VGRNALVAQRTECRATNAKVAGSIPAEGTHGHNARPATGYVSPCGGGGCCGGSTPPVLQWLAARRVPADDHQRFRSSAWLERRALNPRVVSSNLTGTTGDNVLQAQKAERLREEQQVCGSIPQEDTQRARGTVPARQAASPGQDGRCRVEWGGSHPRYLRVRLPSGPRWCGAGQVAIPARASSMRYSPNR
jgi:hypothetical protein